MGLLVIEGRSGSVPPAIKAIHMTSVADTSDMKENYLYDKELVTAAISNSQNYSKGLEFDQKIDSRAVTSNHVRVAYGSPAPPKS